MESEWYIQADGDKVEGPLTVAGLKTKADSGAINHDTPVRKGAGGKWALAGKVNGLFTASAPVNSNLIELMQQELVDGQQSSAAPNTNLRLWGCVDCGRLISKKAAACPNCGRAFGSEQTQDEEIRYPALFAIAALYRVFAVVTAIACLIGGLFLAGSNIPGKEQAIVSLAGYLVLLPTGLWATAGLIVLLIDIEKNTRGKGR